MLPRYPTPLVRLSNLFPDRRIYGKCEFLVPAGSFKIRGAKHLLDRLSKESGPRHLIVPSMGNTALATALAAKLYGFRMTGVVPQSITRAKDEKLQALGAELVKVAGGGSDLLRRATELARETGGYFVHPHLDPLWTDGYQTMVDEIVHELPDCRTIVLPVGGGGLLMGLTASDLSRSLHLVGVEAYNAPTYAGFDHARGPTLADGLILEAPHPDVRRRIEERNIPIEMVQEPAIRKALARLFQSQGLLVEPSSAVPLAVALAHDKEFPEPACIILTGENIAREDFYRLVA
jgi:threonine dehydratase